MSSQPAASQQLNPAPPQPAIQSVAEATFNQKLLGCFDNPIMCVWALCVPCGLACMQGVDAKVLFPDKGNAGLIACLLNCCLCCFGAGWNRKELREVFKYEGSYIIDCLLELFCCCCAVTQEWREVFASKQSNPNTPIWSALSDKAHQ
mmetsp:Transcript_21973/g.40109  ORF Transcript_21973/g.40109 Transcript_21973/m.40109 type:complete len:148 (-) Transcript_21973:147-590(-)